MPISHSWRTSWNTCAGWRARGREEGAISVWNARDDDLFNDIPAFFQEGLLTERDSPRQFQFSQVETDKVIMGLVQDYLNVLREKGLYKIGIQRADVTRTLQAQGLDPGHLRPGAVLQTTTATIPIC